MTTSNFSDWLIATSKESERRALATWLTDREQLARWGKVAEEIAQAIVLAPYDDSAVCSTSLR